MRYGRVLTFAAVILCGCAHKKHARIPVPPPAVQVGQTETGLASWYGHPYHGRQAANGEIYDMEKLTAAHRTLPFNTWVRVENLSNDKFVEVRITDRGPYVNGRILDLSRAAAVQLGMEHGGLAHVQVEIVGHRRPEFVHFAETGSGSLASRFFNGITTAERPTPLMTSWLRILPSDIWLTRRRVLAVLAANHMAHAEVATLALV